MGKFLMHGIIVDEPIRKTTANGMEIVTVKIEERYSGFNGKGVSNVFCIDYVGKLASQIPAGVRLTGKVAIIYGILWSREYNGKYYTDLKGDIFVLASEAGERKGYTVPPNPDNPNLEVRKGGNTESIEVKDDDLPF